MDEDETGTMPAASVPGAAASSSVAEEPDDPEPTGELDESMGAKRRLGRYELLFELASGGMATVYLARDARDVGFDKLVALKRIHSHLAKDPRFVDMFLDEARIASQISHPNVCSVFDFDHVDGVYFIAMEYLLGETVARVMRKAHQDWDNQAPRIPAIAARIVADACEGLHAAHELKDGGGEPLNVVHRDVSPQNIFVTYDGSVRIVDFGIARAHGRLHQTTTGTVKGKYAYMSPEQLRDQPLDRRTDIWALGTVLWEMATGRRLFRRKTEVDTILAVTNEPIPAPSDVRPDLPPLFDEIVLKALARDPEGRYATARELGRDLHTFMTQHGPPMSLADLAEWMEGIFPEELARRRELIDLARQAGGDRVPKVSPEIFGKDRSDSESEDDTTPGTVSEKSVEPQTANRRPGVLLGVGAALLALLGIGTWAVWPGASEEAAADVAELAEPGSEPAVETADEGEPAAPEPEPTPAEPPPAELPVKTTGAEEPPARVASMRDRRRSTRMRTGQPTEMISMAPAADGPPGVVNVVTPGGWWADIYVGNRHFGRSPRQITLPAGRQTIRLLPNGEPPARTVSVDVPPGGTTRVIVPREP